MRYFSLYWFSLLNVEWGRTVASTVLDSVYGYLLESVQDPFLVNTNEFIENMTKAVVPSSKYWLIQVRGFRSYLGSRLSCEHCALVGLYPRMAAWYELEEKGTRMGHSEGPCDR